MKLGRELPALWNLHPILGWALQLPICAPTSGSVYVKVDTWQDQSWAVRCPSPLQDRPFARLSVLDSRRLSDLGFGRCSAPACSRPGWHPQPGWRRMRRDRPRLPHYKGGSGTAEDAVGMDEGSGDAWMHRGVITLVS